MSPRATRITKNSLISVGLLVPIITAVWYLSGVTKDVQANQKTLDKHEQIIEQNAIYMRSIDSRLSNIEGALGTMRRK